MVCSERQLRKSEVIFTKSSQNLLFASHIARRGHFPFRGSLHRPRSKSFWGCKRAHCSKVTCLSRKDWRESYVLLLQSSRFYGLTARNLFFFNGGERELFFDIRFVIIRKFCLLGVVSLRYIGLFCTPPRKKWGDLDHKLGVVLVYREKEKALSSEQKNAMQF